MPYWPIGAVRIKGRPDSLLGANSNACRCGGVAAGHWLDSNALCGRVHNVAEVVFLDLSTWGHRKLIDNPQVFWPELLRHVLFIEERDEVSQSWRIAIGQDDCTTDLAQTFVQLSDDGNVGHIGVS